MYRGLRPAMLAWLMLGLGACLWSTAASAAVEAVSAQTPWRAYLVFGANLTREQGELKIQRPRSRGPAPVFDPADAAAYADSYSPLPPDAWTAASFDDRCWPRYQGDLADFLGGYGTKVDGYSWPALLCLRTAFGVADPAQATDLQLTMSCLGGAVVYVNGTEVGRAYMPTGTVAPLTPGEDYPIEAYTLEDGATALPFPKDGATPDAQLLPRYEQRIRTVTIAIPQRVLVKGRNLLAIAVHRAAQAGPLPREGGWSHLGVREIVLTSARGAGVVAYADAVKGTHLWTADTVEQVTDTPADAALASRSWFHALLWGRGVPVKGIQMANPFDPPAPVRMAVPRNGVASGQAVLSNLDGLRDITASVSDLQGPAGARIPASAISIRYAVQPRDLHYCDVLMDTPPATAKAVPVWLLVQAARDQAPGWYTGTLALEANAGKFSVPVQVLVTGFTVPDAKDFHTSIDLVQSPETIARYYQVAPWSDAHFKLLEKSFALMGQLGNDIIHVPVILGGFLPTARDWVAVADRAQWRLPVVSFVKTARGLEPDFTALEKYLDAYTKYCAPPQAIVLDMWEAGTSKELADAYEGRRKASTTATPKAPVLVLVRDPKTGETSEVEVPGLGEDAGTEFWRRVFDGVHAIIIKRGWDERCIMVGLGGDMRPGSKTSAWVRQLAPYARWNLLSHFSGDPGPKDGKLIATGDLEIGVKEYPWSLGGRALPASSLLERITAPQEFLDLPTGRWHWQPQSPPLLYRTMPLIWGALGRVGLDFWIAGKEGPKNTSFFTHHNTLTTPGPDGAIPTVRLELLREGVQDMELRLAILRACTNLPEDARQPYLTLLDEFGRRVAYGSPFLLSQNELAYDWPAYAARVQSAAAELAGVTSDAAWQRPPQ